MFDDNKRKFPRAAYPCSLTLWCEGGGEDVILTQTVNIGAGGLLVHLIRSIEVGSVLEVSIEFPKQTTSFKCKARAVRCISIADDSGQKLFAVGVEFEPMHDVKHAYLQGVVSDLIALEKPQKN